MSEDGYKIRNQAAIHFITFAVVVPIAIGRVDVFTGKEYRDIVLNSLHLF
jgi:putative transposase